MLGFNQVYPTPPAKETTINTLGNSTVYLEDNALLAWQRWASNLYLLVVVLCQSPIVILLILGFTPDFPVLIKLLFLLLYAMMLVCAVLRHVDHRLRIWGIAGTLYLLYLVGLVVFPQGIALRIAPIIMVIVVLVLIGMPVARVAVGISILLTLVCPLLIYIPVVAHWCHPYQISPPVPFQAAIGQSMMLTTLLIAMLVLLTHYSRFLLQSLNAKQQAADALQRESTNRAMALHSMEQEMAERHRLGQALARIGDEERHRLGQDVHDGVCQQLTGALLRCRTLERHLARGESLSSVEIDELSLLLEAAIDEAHAVAEGLHPLGPEPSALRQALALLARRTTASTGLACRFEAVGDIEVSDSTVAQHLFRIAQEGVSNAVRHAEATQVVLTLQEEGGMLALLIEDNGHGLGEISSTTGMGMRTMRNRAQSLGGSLTLESGAPTGVRVTCLVPRALAPAKGDVHADG